MKKFEPQIARFDAVLTEQRPFASGRAGITLCDAEVLKRVVRRNAPQLLSFAGPRSDMESCKLLPESPPQKKGSGSR